MNDYQASCLGKSRFFIRSTAKRRANQIRRTGGPAFQVYPCRYCGLWHLGNRPGHATHLRSTPYGVVHVEELIQ
ncbi:hypothetical protein ACWCPS_36165 [Streptomyces mauvecolor]